MPIVNFVAASGEAQSFEAPVGETVMRVAVSHDLEGIVAICGGASACATCHVYIADDWWEKVGRPSELEQELLEFAHDPGPRSRLSCQIVVTDKLDGLTVHLPVQQA